MNPSLAKRDSTSVLEDPLTTQIMKAALEAPLPALARAVEDELIELVASYATDAEKVSGVVFRDGEQAAELVNQIIVDWADTLREEPKWSYAKGLYVQRRVPLEPFTALLLPGVDNRVLRSSMKIGVERLLAISLGDAEHADDVLTLNMTAAFPVTDEDAIAFLKHVLRVQHMWRLQNTARIVGKGCGISYALDQLPTARVSPEERLAMDIYDSRNSTGPDEVGLAGTKVWFETQLQSPTTIAVCTYVHEDPGLRLMPPELASTLVARPSPDLHYRPICDVSLVDLEPLARMVDEGLDHFDWHQDELPALLALLHALGTSADQLYSYQMQRFGYVRVSREQLFRILADSQDGFLALAERLLPGLSNVDATKPSALFKVLLQGEGCLWPVRDGPIVRKSPDGALLVDIVSITRRVLWLFLVGRTGGGHLPNVRGTHFELSVQAEVDGYGLQPKGESTLLGLRGRQLFRDNKNLTDIDAVAEMPDGTVLLIQAKSYPYTPEYGAGGFRAVRNMTTKVEAEVLDWQKKVADLAAHRVGKSQNYELPTGVDIVAVFVTPFPVFVWHPLCSEEVLPGVKAVCSLDELSQYLKCAVVT